MTKKYEKELQDFKDAEAAAEEAEAEAAEAADDNAVEVEAADDNAVEGEAAGDNAVEGEEKDDSTSIAPKLPNDYPAAWAECSISAEGSATLTDVIWHPVDQATKAGIPKFYSLEQHGGFEMSRRSKKFELTSANMQLLSLVKIHITVYQGHQPGNKKDVIVGTLSVPMLAALKDGSMNAKMPLELHGEERKPYEVNFSIGLDTALGEYAGRGRFFSFAQCKLDVPLPLLVSGHAKFEMRVGTIDALLGCSSTSDDQEWIIPGGTVPEGNVPEKDDGEGKGKHHKAAKEEPKGKGKKKKGKGKGKAVETKEPPPEAPKKEPQELKAAEVVWPSPAFSLFLAEEKLDSLLNLSLTQPTLALPVKILMVSSEVDGSTVPQALQGTVDIAAMCEVDCTSSQSAVAMAPVVPVPAAVDADGVPTGEAEEVECILSCTLSSDPALLPQDDVPTACSQEPLQVISVPDDPPKKVVPLTTGQKLDLEIDKVVGVVLEQCNDTDSDDSPMDNKAFRREVFHKLNVSGNYFRFKESIKVAMIRDAQSRAKQAAAAATEAGTEASEGKTNVTSDEFVCRFYSQLMQHVHRRLNGSTNHARVRVKEELKETPLDTSQYRTLALEGKHSDDWEVARDVCERFVRDFPKCLWALVLLAKSCLRLEEFSRASDVLQRAVKLVCTRPSEDPEMELRVLCMYGILLLVEEAPDEAEVCFNETVKRLLSSGSQDEAQMDTMVALFGLSHASRTGSGGGRCLFVQGRGLARHPRRAALALINVAGMLLENGLPELASTAIGMATGYAGSMQTQSDGVSLRLLLAQARQCFAVGEFEGTADYANKALQIDSECAEAVELLGHVYYTSGYSVAGGHPGKMARRDDDDNSTDEAIAFYLQSKDNYELCVRHNCAVDPAAVPLLVYNRLGQIYLMQGDFAAAKEVYLRVCSRCQSASSWLGVATASIRAMQLADAEQALAQANRLDKTNPNVWGKLALLRLMIDENDGTGVPPPSPALGGRPRSMADKCLSYALKFKLSDAELLFNIAFYYLGRLDLETAEKLLRLSIQYDGGDARVHEALADVLRRTKRDNEALLEYRRACSLSQKYEDKSRLGLLISAFGERLGI